MTFGQILRAEPMPGALTGSTRVELLCLLCDSVRLTLRILYGGKEQEVASMAGIEEFVSVPSVTLW
jgi:hypothetical protein